MGDDSEDIKRIRKKTNDIAEEVAKQVHISLSSHLEMISRNLMWVNQVEEALLWYPK